MAAKLKIAFVSAEVRPFAATGGLGDVAASLPKELRRMGHDVRLIMPNYAMVEGQGYGLEEAPGLGNTIPVPNLGDIYVKIAKLPESDVPVYFLESVGQDLYSRTKARDQLYGWPDDARRFTLLCRGTLELLNVIGWKPDVIHCNDWHAGLIPAYLDSVYKYDFLNTSTVYTTHNLLYSGPGGLSTRSLREAGLGLELIPVLHPHEYWGHFNFAKGALAVADVVTTVSPTYAEEILQPESAELPYEVRITEGSKVLNHRCRIPNGVGFYEMLRQRRQVKPFMGILNGIDTDYWNPRTDARLELPTLRGLARSLPQPVSVEALPLEALGFSTEDSDERIAQRKALNKRRLQQLCGLEENEKALLIGRVARIGDQKDFLLMVEEARALQNLCGATCQFVILGGASAQDVAGQWYKREFTRLDREQSQCVCYINGRWERWLGKPLPADADFEFEHLIYAGCDAFLIPSLYEPCGLTQMVSFRYGAAPIVRQTGGLADTVRDLREGLVTQPGGCVSTGFVFAEPSPAALIDAVQRAAEAFRQPALWRQIVRSGMQADFSWGRSAQRYVEAYQRAIEVKKR
jgi:starch synthase